MEENSGIKAINSSAKIALLTASYGGLGNTFANNLLKRGYALILTGRKPSKLEEMKKRLYNLYDLPIMTFQCDTANEEDVGKLKTFLVKNNIKLDMLVNIAGIENEGWFYNQATNDVLSIAKTNVVGTLHMIHELHTEKKQDLYIINISSMAGFYNMPMKAVYSSSKRFIIELTKTLNIELNDHNVYLTCITPAGLKTRKQIVEKIDSQGLMGKLTTVDLDKAVSKSIDKTLHKKWVYIPGFINQILYLISRIIPSKWNSKMIKRRWVKSSKKLKN